MGVALLLWFHSALAVPVRKCDLSSLYSPQLFLNGTNGYLALVDQYARSSLPEHVQPTAILVPQSVDDIQKALKFAKRCNFPVSIRSGGHQYSGYSSCNGIATPCIQIDLGNFGGITVRGSKVLVGPAIRLKDLDSVLFANGFFIPHGECPTVAVGGHAQTGGLGVFFGSVGAFAQFVDAFDIVLADGSYFHVTRPSQIAPAADDTVEGDDSSDDNLLAASASTPLEPPKSLNENLFWAVLGGNPGSFGVVTNYELRTVRTADLSLNFFFCSIQNIFSAPWIVNVLTFLNSYYNETVAGKIDALHVIAKQGTLLRIVVRDTNLLPRVMGDLQNLFAAYGVSPAPCYTTSTIVPQLPIVPGLREREYPLPFLKSARLSNQSWTPEAIQILATQTVMLPDGFFPLLEISLAQPGNSRPDIALAPGPSTLLALDVFYVPASPTSRQIASTWLDSTWSLLRATPTFPSDLRTLFATFADDDIDLVWPSYYTESTYLRLKKIKKRVDPGNVFSTPFTIPVKSD